MKKISTVTTERIQMFKEKQLTIGLERIASRWRPAFSSHLVSRASSDGRRNTL
jgi:hypothetical protein